MPTMNVDLIPALAELVKHEVDIGNYQNASELVRDALRLLRREKERDSLKLAALGREIANGVADANAGDFDTRSFAEIAEAVLNEKS